MPVPNVSLRALAILMIMLCVPAYGQIIFSDTYDNDSFNQADDTGLVDVGIARLPDGQLSSYYPVDDYDYFFFTVTEKAPLPLHLSVTMSGVAEDIRRRMSLYDSEQLRLTTSQTSIAGDDVECGTYVVESGLYYVMVSARTSWRSPCPKSRIRPACLERTRTCAYGQRPCRHCFGISSSVTARRVERMRTASAST